MQVGVVARTRFGTRWVAIHEVIKWRWNVRSKLMWHWQCSGGSTIRRELLNVSGLSPWLCGYWNQSTDLGVKPGLGSVHSLLDLGGYLLKDLVPQLQDLCPHPRIWWQSTKQDWWHQLLEYCEIALLYQSYGLVASPFSR